MWTTTIILAAAFVGVFSTRNILDETTCQTHQRNAGGANAPLHWDIRCDTDGKYLPKQCTVETPKWCACYNKEERVTQPSRSTKECGCFLARHEATNRQASQCDVPVCERSGEYRKKQCCDRTRQCRCVHPITGETVQQATANMNLQCA
ncbi:uncharacterized protein CDAR_39011 [Caerostris darwini]|uniref:Thyroglobulin type-1 domain-containing protein n=1 Tax=Caerostris darwini TaxID=1538125 RepID=A0AAV4UQS6_9ARAC|nr:uncharacterized protein CDAR_39011 [Caerostris darwini]